MQQAAQDYSRLTRLLRGALRARSPRSLGLDVLPLAIQIAEDTIKRQFLDHASLESADLRTGLTVYRSSEIEICLVEVSADNTFLISSFPSTHLFLEPLFSAATIYASSSPVSALTTQIKVTPVHDWADFSGGILLPSGFGLALPEGSRSLSFQARLLGGSNLSHVVCGQTLESTGIRLESATPYRLAAILDAARDLPCHSLDRAASSLVETDLIFLKARARKRLGSRP